MAFKNDLSLSLFCKISLNEQWSEENVRNVSYTCVWCSRSFKRLFLQLQEFSLRSSKFIKTKLGDFSKIIHQNLPIFDKNSFIKAQKNSIIVKVFGTEGIRLQDLNKTQSFVFRFCSPKAFKWLSTTEKNLQWKLVLNFIVAKSLKKFFLKLSLCIANLEGLVQTSLLLFWSVSECRVPLFNQLIQLLA